MTPRMAPMKKGGLRTPRFVTLGEPIIEYPAQVTI